MPKLSNKSKIIFAILLCGAVVAVLGGIGLLGGGRARVQGYSGSIEMSAEVREDGGFRLTIDKHSEGYGIGDLALDRVVDAVNAQQNLDVDIISGATETSAAAIECARMALEQAGVDIEALEAGTDRKGGEFIDHSCDVVVVGAGGSGLTAALTAAQNGSRVIVVEKMGIAGGSTVRSEGMLLAAGTELQAYNGVKDSSSSLASYLYALSNEKISQQNRIVSLAEHSAENLLLLEELGVRFSDTLLASEDNGIARVHLAVDPKGNGGGGTIVKSLLTACEAAGVQFLYNSEVYELARDIAGEIIGVRAKTPDGDVVTVWANATIIATGGYDRNAVLIDDYNASKALPAYSYSAPGNTGDGIKLSQQAGAKILDGSLIAELYDFYAGSNGSAGLLVTPAGERFVDESLSAFRQGSAIQTAGYGTAWLITDSKGHKSGFNAGIEKGTVIKADSIEALAQAINAPNLVNAVKTYNSLCKAGADQAYGKSADHLDEVDGGPYYAVKYVLKSYGTMGGIRTNANGQATSAAGLVPGLYACGEAANGVYFSENYPGFGSTIAQALESGRLAGLGASEYAKSEQTKQM